MKKMKLKLKVVKVSLIVVLMGLVLTGTTFILKDDKSNAFNAVGSGQESYTQTIPFTSNYWNQSDIDYGHTFNSDYFNIDGSSNIIKITVQNTYATDSSHVDPSKMKLKFYIKEERPSAKDGFLTGVPAGEIADDDTIRLKNIDGHSVAVYGSWHIEGYKMQRDLNPGETDTTYVSPDKKSSGINLKYIYISFYISESNQIGDFPGATITFTRTHVPW